MGGNSDFVLQMDDEFDEIARVLQRQRVVVLTGEAGAGKSVVVGLLGAARFGNGSRVVVVRCSARPDRPLEPIAALAAALLDDDAAIRSPRDRDVLEFLAGRTESGARHDRDWTFEVLAGVLATRVDPTVVIIEDVHWAPPLTRRVLRRLVDEVAVRRSKTRVLLTERTEIGVGAPARFGTGSLHEIGVQPWSAEAIARYLRGCGGIGSWIDGAALWILERSGGNPLFIRELSVDALRDHADGEQFEPTKLSGGDLRSAVDERISALPEDDRRWLMAAAVLGTSVDIAELQALNSAGEVPSDRLLRSGIVLRPSPSRLDFAHELFVDALLDQLAPGDGLELHDAAFDVVAASPDAGTRVDALARLAAGAAELDAQRAIDASVRAGRAAGARLAHENAIAHYQHARGLVEHIGGRTARWCELGIAIGEQLIQAGDVASTALLQVTARRAAELEEFDLMGEAVYQMCRLGPTHWVGTTDEEAAALIEEALEKADDLSVRVRLCGSGAVIHFFPDVDGRSRELYELGDELAAGNDELAATLYITASHVALSKPGDLARRRESASVLHRASTTHNRLDFAWTALLMDIANSIEGGQGDVRGPLDRMREIRPTLGNVSRLWEECAIEGCVALLTGDYETSEALVHEAFAHGAGFAPSLAASAFGGGLMGIRLAQGSMADLHPAMAQLVDDQPAIGVWRAARALTAVAIGDHELATTDLHHSIADDAATLSRDFTMSPGLICLGEAALRLDDRSAMRTVLGLMAPFDGLWTWFGVGTVGPVDLTAARLERHLGDADAVAVRLRRLDQSCRSLGATGYRRLVDELR